MPLTAPLTVDTLLDTLERMPAQQAAAVRVLYVADDPMSSAADLAAAVSADPVITAQVMRLANSAYYGLSGRIRSADFAVTVVGFQTVRSIAAAFAAGALGDGATRPHGFWTHAAASAAGAATVSGRVKVARPDAFSLGLLHDLGAALLCRIDFDVYQSIEAGTQVTDSRQSALLEKRAFGMSHATAAAVALENWRFPADVVDAIATHHDQIDGDPTPLSRVLHAGEALAFLAEYEDVDRYEASKKLPRYEAALLLADVDPKTAWDLSRNVRAEAEAIASSFN